MLSFNEIYNLSDKGEWLTEGDDVQYKFYLDNSDKKIYVIYQCTTSDEDWKNNFRFLTDVVYIESRKIQCHRGFLRAFLSAKDVIFKQLQSYMVGHPDYKVIFTGHSFGGAMSFLSGLYFYREFNQKANIITFGSPKVVLHKGDLKFVKPICFNIENCFYNWGDRNDLITYMPPYYTKLGHNRVGDRFSLFKIFKPNVYHLVYDDIVYPCQPNI